MARPRLDIDPKQVEALAGIGCTIDEIASVLGCSTKTIERRFVGVIKKGREGFRASLRRLQYKAAQKGNASLLIWLGKQYLNQADQPKGTDAEDYALDLDLAPDPEAAS